VSTAGTTFNAETVTFYRDLGADRIILPRHVSLEEIETLASKSEGVELEVFILNSRCANIDGFCTFQHGLADLVQDTQAKKDFENACMLLYDISVSVDGQSEVPLDETFHLPVSWERQHLWSGLHIDDRPCGACALYEFEAMGITGVKIAGRQNSTEKKLKDVRFLRDLLDFLRKEKPSQGEFRAAARRRYQENYRWPCVVFKCYYPSVLTQPDGQ
jgi:collagenase-like PrtC family protease